MTNFDLAEQYSRKAFFQLLSQKMLPDFEYDVREAQLPEKSIFTKVTHLGSSKTCSVSVFEAECSERDGGRRIAITQDAFRMLRRHGISNAIIAFTWKTKQWRLSLLTSKLELVEGKVLRKTSNPRRYSYLLGPGAKTNTPHKFLAAGEKADSLDDLRNKFSVEVVNKQFYIEIAKHFTELVGGERSGVQYPGLLRIQQVEKPSNKYPEFAVRLIGRIMFCWFLKEKKSMNGTPLIPEIMLSVNAVKQTQHYYQSVLEPLFFELLNTRIHLRKDKYQSPEFIQIPYLNGGLFSPQPDDHYPSTQEIFILDEWFISLFEVLESYNFTVDENTAYDVELSIDPEMLGRIFENLLAEINPETGKSAKKSTGSFYTPRNIVDYMVDISLLHYLMGKTEIQEKQLEELISYNKEDELGDNLSKEERLAIIKALGTLKILDPACGSGAFPIGLLQKIVYILQQVDKNSDLWVELQYQSVTSAELRKEIRDKQEKGLFDYVRKLGVIRESIYGVDIQTIATEIAKLRCYLTLIVEEKVDDFEENRGIQPLPNLDFKFISANSLVSLESKLDKSDYQTQLNFFHGKDYVKELERVRQDHFSANHQKRLDLENEFKNIQDEMSKVKDESGNYSKKFALFSTWKPFENIESDWFCPELMLGTPTFDIVIANPPYIHLEHIKEQSRAYKALGFRTYRARGDIYVLFYERGIDLLRKNGVLCYITSNKWMRAAYGQPLRKFFAEKTNPIQLIDFAGQQIFDATVDTNISVISKSKNEKDTKAIVVKNKDSISDLSYHIKSAGVSIPFITSESWTILSDIEQSIKRKIETVGIPLKDWDVSINFGIKTGLNDAFIIPGEKKDELVAADPRSAEIIRPVLRGRDIKRYEYDWAGLYVILASFGSHEWLEEEYPAVYTHLLQYKAKLENRGQCRYTASGKPNLEPNAPYPGQHHWLELDNNPSSGYLDEFSKQKIVWKRIGSFLRFAHDENGYFGLDSTCIATGRQSKFVTCFLNSLVGNYQLSSSPKTGTGDLLISVCVWQNRNQPPRKRRNQPGGSEELHC